MLERHDPQRSVWANFYFLFLILHFSFLHESMHTLHPADCRSCRAIFQNYILHKRTFDRWLHLRETESVYSIVHISPTYITSDYVNIIKISPQ